MKSFIDALTEDTTPAGWQVTEYGAAVVSLPDGKGGEYTVEFEPLLFGQFYVAVYHDGDLIANKVPVRPGIPAAHAAVDGDAASEGAR